MRLLNTVPALLLAAGAQADDIHVFDGGSVQAAVNSAQDGDRVLVHSGVFAAGINFLGKDIEILALYGPQQTVIDGKSIAVPAVTFASGEPLTARLSGFLIESEGATHSAILVDGASATVTDCILRGRNDNTVTLGGGIRAQDANVVIAGCNFENLFAGSGGGVYAEKTELRVVDCEFSECAALNRGGGIRSSSASEGLEISNCRFDSCSTSNLSFSAAVFLDQSDGAITGCDFRNNFGGRATVSCAGDISISRCVFEYNTHSSSSGSCIRRLSVTTAPTEDSVFRKNTVGEYILRGAGASPDDALMRNSVLAVNTTRGPASACRLENCTIAYNTQHDMEDCFVWQCIVWGGVTDFQNIAYSDVQGGYPGPGNFDADPFFADPVGLDFNVLPGSPCIGAGEFGGNVGAELVVGIQDCNGNGVSDNVDAALGNDCNLNGIPDECDLASGASRDCDANGVPDECEPLGTRACTGRINSAGFAASLVALGSSEVGDNCLELRAFGLPLNETVRLIGSSAAPPNFPISPFGNGRVCVPLPRVLYTAGSGSTGIVSIDLDLNALPNGQAVFAGETWRFQAWYEDGGSTNTSGGVEVVFQ